MGCQGSVDAHEAYKAAPDENDGGADEPKKEAETKDDMERADSKHSTEKRKASKDKRSASKESSFSRDTLTTEQLEQLSPYIDALLLQEKKKMERRFEGEHDEFEVPDLFKEQQIDQGLGVPLSKPANMMSKEANPDKGVPPPDADLGFAAESRLVPSPDGGLPREAPPAPVLHGRQKQLPEKFYDEFLTLPEKFEALISIGYTENQARQAIERNRGNLPNAAHYLERLSYLANKYRNQGMIVDEEGRMRRSNYGGRRSSQTGGMAMNTVSAAKPKRKLSKGKRWYV